ncbi:helix-turn-helix domain-containing protein [Pelotomaculum isophthalicicum JI]|uniref:Helix-turn-helix domain-containing protein n=1 Tax=Pelotomaculum isophthalicicum JI TaxID=947010 RepID=A0A9X4H756_9FIRM|nr:helix-turn-helix domain-containing protein [Pelotomaculum isophthalicicum]MDF9409743.1 helix-turn-helix domain-containing protein [Pelotomaculum isophthalicicum JI]
MNLEEAAEFLRISQTTLKKLLREGEIPARKVGREWRLSRQALLKWLESGQVQKED